GLGWLEEAFSAFGAPTYQHRGSLSDEHIRIFREVWTEASPSFDGRWYKFSGFGFSPKPLQKPHIPIWIGGASDAALRRVVRLGDGWHPSHLPVDQYAVRLARLRELCQERGRPSEEILLSVSVKIRLDLSRPRAGESDQVVPPDLPPYLLGSPAQVANTLRRYGELGVQHIVCEPVVAGNPINNENVS